MTDGIPSKIKAIYLKAEIEAEKRTAEIKHHLPTGSIKSITSIEIIDGKIYATIKEPASLELSQDLGIEPSFTGTLSVDKTTISGVEFLSFNVVRKDN